MKIKNVAFDEVYCSPSDRAKDTLNYMLNQSNKNKNPNIQISDLLNDKNHGIFSGFPWNSIQLAAKVNLFLY